MIQPFAYTRPESLLEALSALQEREARALVGGTDLLVDMRAGLSRPGLIVDLKGLPDLEAFQVDSDGIRIGGRVTINQLIASEEMKEVCPLLVDAAWTIATHQVRNRATVVGNLCTASPAADMAPPLLALDARLVVSSTRGERILPLDQFFAGPKRNTLRPGEIVLQVEIPLPSPGTCATFFKKTRLAGHDLATVNLAGLFNAKLGLLRIGVGACAPTPLLLKGTEQVYRESGDQASLVRNLNELAQAEIAPIDDLRGSADYRRAIVAVFLRRLVERIGSAEKEATA